MKLQVQRYEQVFFQSTCCSALEQSATECRTRYISHSVQDTSQQLYSLCISGFRDDALYKFTIDIDIDIDKIRALKASPIELINVKRQTSNVKLKLKLKLKLNSLIFK